MGAVVATDNSFVRVADHELTLLVQLEAYFDLALRNEEYLINFLKLLEQYRPGLLQPRLQVLQELHHEIAVVRVLPAVELRLRATVIVRLLFDREEVLEFLQERWE